MAMSRWSKQGSTALLARMVLRHLLAALKAIEQELPETPENNDGDRGDDRNAPAEHQSRQPSLLTVSELAQRLSLSRATIYKMIVERRIDHYKLGSRVLFGEHHVDDFLSTREQHRIAPPVRRRGR